MTSPLCATELVERGRALVVTLDNPPDNAVTPSMLEGVAEALGVAAAEGGPDLVVLTGRERVFSKGFDVATIRSHRDQVAHRASLTRCNEVVNRLEAFPKPVIAAINGHCLGAGLELAMACHIRLCVEKARVGLPELSRGLIPGLGGIPRLTRLVGRAKALELIAAGDLITAEEAHRLGLVNRVLPRAGFMDGVLAFARAVLSVDQALIREVVRLSGAAPPAGHHDLLREVESAVRVAGTR
ncbi:MAG: enoyl-CoA hydratase/isomerase family protein [Candidatus Rokubacteria bacterium]|nr:enoyl-CoA hydratase/isomerase family protein [Candidatus Rokubacteria bacterium]